MCKRRVGSSVIVWIFFISTEYQRDTFQIPSYVNTESASTYMISWYESNTIQVYDCIINRIFIQSPMNLQITCITRNYLNGNQRWHFNLSTCKKKWLLPETLEKDNVLEKQSVVVVVNTEENNQTTATQKQSVIYGAINTVTSELFIKWRWKSVEMKLIREIGKWMLEESRWEKEGFTLAKIGEKKNGRQHIWKTLASMLWRRLRRKKTSSKFNSHL
jgi:hypothetical protein